MYRSHTSAFSIFSENPCDYIQFSSVAQSCLTLCDPMKRSTPGLPVRHQLPEFTQTHVHRVGDAIPPSHPLSSSSPPAPNPSQHQSLSIESTLRMRWPKFWSFSFRISCSKEHPGLISFRMNWLDLLAVQGTLKSLLQYHSYISPPEKSRIISSLNLLISNLKSICNLNIFLPCNVTVTNSGE